MLVGIRPSVLRSAAGLFVRAYVLTALVSGAVLLVPVAAIAAEPRASQSGESPRQRQPLRQFNVPGAPDPPPPLEPEVIARAENGRVVVRGPG